MDLSEILQFRLRWYGRLFVVAVASELVFRPFPLGGVPSLHHSQVWMMMC